MKHMLVALCGQSLRELVASYRNDSGILEYDIIGILSSTIWSVGSLMLISKAHECSSIHV